MPPSSSSPEIKVPSSTLPGCNEATDSFLRALPSSLGLKGSDFDSALSSIEPPDSLIDEDGQLTGRQSLDWEQRLIIGYNGILGYFTDLSQKETVITQDMLELIKRAKHLGGIVRLANIYDQAFEIGKTKLDATPTNSSAAFDRLRAIAAERGNAEVSPEDTNERFAKIVRRFLTLAFPDPSPEASKASRQWPN